MGRLDDKVAIVTGGGSGIGRASALKLAAEGAVVAVGNRNEEAGRQTVAMIEQTGGKASFRKTDVTKEDDVRALVDHTVSTYGKLDIALNNAGTEGAAADATSETVDNYRAIFDVNVLGVALSMKHEIPAMLSNSGGSIINVASVAGLIGFPEHGMYVASKHAVLGLTKTAALEVGSRGVRVNAVSPAAIETDMLERFAGQTEEERQQAREYMTGMHPIGRLGRPEEIADTVAWLASDEASFVLGQSITVDGGFTAL